jgi:PKD repeat protein
VKQVLVLNVPPESRFTYTPSNPTDLDEILFNSTSFDPDGFIVNVTWYLSDGFSTNESRFTHRFQDDGLYNVTLM